MGKYNYSPEEEKLLKVLKMNQDDSNKLLLDSSMRQTRQNADIAITDSLELLKSLGYHPDELISSQHKDAPNNSISVTTNSFEELASQANKRYDNIILEDLLTTEEFQRAYDDLDKINQEFSARTSIINKTDLSFLALATAIQVTKALITPLISSKFGYGESFDADNRLDHNDKSIENAHRQANATYKEKHEKSHGTGQWINLLYQTPPYDTTVGSPNIGKNMEGKYHRIHTLGHDPMLGWIFGTANILTDIITLNDFSCYRVLRKPKLHITQTRVTNLTMFREAREMIKADSLNLPAAIFAQKQHLKSDVYTKCGLPIPLLEAFTPELAGKLYKSQYDALCFARDLKIIGVSAMITMLFDMIIGLVHGLYYNPKEEPQRDLYEVRTRKILLISNTIASTSSVIFSSITSNPKNLDIGMLLATVVHLFSDVRFIARIKEEFIENELTKQITDELSQIDALLSEYT